MIRCVFVVYRNGSSDTANRNDDRCEMVFGTTNNYQYSHEIDFTCRRYLDNSSPFLFQCSSDDIHSGNLVSNGNKTACNAKETGKNSRSVKGVVTGKLSYTYGMIDGRC